MSDPNLPVLRAQDFVNSIGVNAAIAYTDGGYANIPQDIGQIQYLGTNQVRCQLTDGEDYFGNKNGSAPLASYIALAQAGQHFTIEISGSNGTTASATYQLDLVKRLMAAVPGSVVAVEGTNEINNDVNTAFNGTKGQAGAIALQRFIYSTVTTDPAFGRVDAQGNPIASTVTDAQGNPVPPGVAVDYFTGYGATGEGEGPNPDPRVTPGLADYDTQHSYPNNQAPREWENPSRTLPNAVGDPTIPHDYTESGGYFTGPGGVSLHDQAAYTADLLLDAAQTGATRTNLYELKDAYGTNSSYGLYDPNGNAKPAATAIHNLTALLTDTGADATTFTAKPIGVTLTGLPDSGHSMQLAKSDGSTDLALWAEPGPGTTAPTSSTTITLDGQYDAVVYDPLAGATPIATYTDVSSLVVGLTDHPIIVDLTAHAGTGSTPPSTTSPTGGSDTGGAGTPPSTTSPTGGQDTGGAGTPPSTTSPTGGQDTGGAGTPPSTTSPTGGQDTGGAGTPPSTTSPTGGQDTGGVTTTPAAPGIDVGALTASITQQVTSDVLGKLHDQAVARHDLAREHAELRLENEIGGHFAGARGDLAGTAVVEALPEGTNYRAELHLLKALDGGQDAQHGLAYFDHALGVDGAAVRQAFVSSLDEARQAHQGGAS